MTQEQFERVAMCADLHDANISLRPSGFHITVQSPTGLRQLTHLVTYTEVFQSYVPADMLCDKLRNMAEEVRK